MVERWEEVLIRNADVRHPVEQIPCPGVTNCELHKLAGDSHVCGAFSNVEAVRRWIFTRSSPLWRDPRVLEPIREDLTANDETTHLS